MSGKEFETIKEMIDYRGKCPLCQENTSMNMVGHDLFSGFASQRILGNLPNPSDVTITIKDNKSGMIKFEKSGICIDIDNNKIIFPDAKSCADTGCYLSFTVHITCDHEHIGRALDCRGAFSFYPDNFDADWKGPVIYKLEEIQIEAEAIVAYEVCDGVANVVKIINNYASDVSTVSLASSSIDGEFSPQFIKVNRQALSDHFLKFKDPNKIMGRINSILLMK